MVLSEFNIVELSTAVVAIFGACGMLLAVTQKSRCKRFKCCCVLIILLYYIVYLMNTINRHQIQTMFTRASGYIMRENMRRAHINDMNIIKAKNKAKKINRKKNFLKTMHNIDFFFKTNTEHENISKKDKHRLLCIKQLPFIRSKIITEFGDKSGEGKETILIEFRQMPHVEYLVRNTILKLKNWNHTIVCGNNNYDMIYEMCENIHNNLETKIKIIKLDVGNITVKQYSDMLTTKEFWNRFEGEKLLVYQEDTFLFHNNIQKFLNYDYVGAPWKILNYHSNTFVGNGGFSLRSRSVMIKCIEHTDPSIDNLPEDVYFAKTMKKNNIGNIAPMNIAKMFSQEQLLGDNPIGGHAFWIANNKIDENVYKIK